MLRGKVKNIWKKEEIELLLKIYKIVTHERLTELFPLHSITSIKLKARKLGLKQEQGVKFKNRSLVHKGVKNGMYGKTGPNKGKKASLKTKEKLKQYRKKHPISMPGASNPRYGKPGTMLGKKMTKESVEKANKTKKSNYEKLSDIEKVEWHKKRSQNAIKALVNRIRKETVPEKITKEILKEIGVIFEQEKRIGYYLCDFVIGSKVIEVQGDYWHANPIIYVKDKINHTQKLNIIRDKSKKTYLENKNYKIIYLWEKDIMINKKDIKSRLIDFLINN